MDRSHAGVLRTRFGTYGYRPPRSVVPEADGLRIRLPGEVAGVSQTGVYSYFTLAGDCEVTATYELINLPAPQKGYGTSVGLAFDAGDGGSRGSIQRTHSAGKGDGYVFQTSLAGGQAPEEYHFVPTKARRGRIGLRRVKKELVFLTSDSPAGPLEEVARLPFPDGTIRAVRFFADAGGSPTAVDVRLREIAVRAEELTGGIPQGEQRGSGWWRLAAVVPAVGVVLLVGLWRFRRRRAAEGAGTIPPQTAIRRP